MSRGASRGAARRRAWSCLPTPRRATGRSGTARGRRADAAARAARRRPVPHLSGARRRGPPPVATVTVRATSARARRRRPHWFVAHLVARRSGGGARWSRSMNAQCIGALGRGARGRTRTTAGSTCSTPIASMGWRERLQARRACAPARTCPTRGIDAARRCPTCSSTSTGRRRVARRRALSAREPAARSAGRARRPHLRRLSRRDGRSTVDAMQAWILDESPGTYRWGEIDPPEPGPDDVRDPRRGQRAEPHGPVGHPGLPEAALPHVPGCDVAGVVEAVGAAVTDVAGRRRGGRQPGGRRRSPRSWPSATTRPMGPGFQILGEQRWGGHGELGRRPGAQRRAKPAGRTWEECAAYPLATSPPGGCCGGPG